MQRMPAHMVCEQQHIASCRPPAGDRGGSRSALVELHVPTGRSCRATYARAGWTLRYIETNCTATIWRNDFGVEPRVEHRGELIESRLSRFGEAPLLRIAAQIRSNLIAQGWF